MSHKIGTHLGLLCFVGVIWSLHVDSCYILSAYDNAVPSAKCAFFCRWMQKYEWYLVNMYGHHQGCLNNPIFLNLGLFAACWALFMCHYELWPTLVSHPFSFLNSSLGLARGKHYQKITIPVFRVVLQNFAIPGYFPYILFYRYIISSLSSGWFVIAVCGSVSVRELVKWIEYFVNWSRVTVSNDKSA